MASTAIIKHDPIPAPDAERPTQIASTPEWLASLKSAVSLNDQPVAGMKGLQEVMTLPAHLMPTEAQRLGIETHIAQLNTMLARTPQKNRQCEKATFALITKLMLTLEGRNTSELATEAQGEAYMIALSDIPHWAVEAAIERWYRGHCGNDLHGNRFDYRFRPDPETLRRLSFEEVWKLKTRIKELEPILAAVEFIDTSEMRERGSLAMIGLMQRLKEKRLSEGLSFDDAIEVGKQVIKQKTESKKGD